METKIYKISDLSFDPANARKHGTKNIAAIRGSLARFKQQRPIIIDKNNVVRAGNGTLAAAIELGWTEIKAIVSDLEGTELTAFAIADNRTAELAEWDVDTLHATLKDLKDLDFDIGEIGFDGSDFDIPEFEPDISDKEDKIPEKKLIITIQFDDEDTMEMIFAELNDRGFKVKI